MADAPRQLNAAQAARRKILATKPRRVHNDERAEMANLNSVPLFAPMPGANNGGNNIFGGGGGAGGGGLFGGSVQATGSFDFSAPSLTQMPSFNFSPTAFNSGPSQPSPWGTNSTSMSGVGNTMTEDPRADTTGEEAARKNKPFRMNGGSEASPSPSQPFSNPFQPVPQSTLNQAAPPDVAKSNPFQFGATAAPSPSGSFTFGATPAKTQEQPSTNLFAFGSQSQQAPSTNSGFTFGTPPPQEQPASNIFSFGQTQTKQPTSTGISFGSTPAPTTNLFGQTQPQQPVSTGASFGSTPAPTANLFNFGQTPSQSQAPMTSSIFSSTPTPAQPTTNFFSQPTSRESTPTNIFAPSQPQSSMQTPNIFGKVNSQPTPTSETTSNISTPAPTANGIFGTQTQNTPNASAPSLFGNQNRTPAGTNNVFSGSSENLFGNLTQPTRSASPGSVFDKEAKENTPPISNLFGTPKPPVTSNITESSGPASNIFGTPKPSTGVFGMQPAASGSNIFGDKIGGQAATSLFGSPKTQSNAPTNPFANLNQPSPQAVNGNTHSPAVTSAALDSVPAIEAPPSPRPAPASLQNISPAIPATSNSTFSQSHVSNGFKGLKQTESVLPSVESDDSSKERRETTSLFNSSGQPSTSNLFSSMKPVDAPEDAAQPAPRGMFPSLSQSAQSTTNNIFSKPSASESGIAITSKAMITSDGLEQNAGMPEYFANLGQVADSVIESEIPPYFNEEQRLQFFAAYRIRALNKAIKAIVENAGLELNYEPVLLHYKKRRDEINGDCDTGIKNLKRRGGEVGIDEDANSPAKRSKMSSNSSMVQYPVQSPEKAQLSNSTLASPERRPESRTNLSPAKSQPFLNGSTTPKAPPPMPQLFPPQNNAPVSPSPKGKRKADVQITQLDPEGEAAEKQSQKMAKLNGSTNGSETSNIFKNILDKPAEPPTSSSPKKVFSLTKASDEPVSPRANPFASLAMPPSSMVSTPPAVKAPISGIGVTTPTPSNPFASKAATPSSNMFSKPNSTPVTAVSNSTSVPKTGSTSSSMFSQPATGAPSFFGSKPATAPAVSSPLAKAPTTVDDLSEKSTASGGSIFKPPIFGSGPTSAPASGSSIKPPTFGTPVNFLAQFGKKADKSAAEREREEMEKAKEEDMDSDEDEAEWEAAYKEKRKASREELKRIAKSGKQFSVSDTSGSETEKPKSPSKSIFGQPKAASSSVNSLFPPIPRSGASSPGLMSSNASSVFDGLAPTKPVAFGDNIFGHLSDVDSGADSGKGNDADDDTDESNSEADDEEPEDSEDREEADDERKDATYDPKVSEPAVPGTPGTPTTPVEETGAGIASTKKPKIPFSFGTPSNSGTSTPGGSLFDRITRDANGNPVRQLPTEDKENAGPSTSSIFGTNNAASSSLFNFSRPSAQDSSKSPGDNTWKPDTPIKFGASTATPTFTFGSSPSTPPAVNVQAPTPTKAGQFAGLFGSTNPSKSTTPTPASGAVSPFAGLFGNTSAPKPSSPSIFSNLGNQDSSKPPAVGFNFGGPSTATSSLFPSVAGSGVTSRATTPGGTTDGESANETNGDEHEAPLEQIDLASGGVGEEDEESVFQVRTKAQKFEEPKKGGGGKSWVVKGLGNLRILKHKETGKSRLLMRQDPSGTIVLNKRILPMAYTATQKTVKLLAHDDTGKGMETWLLQVKTPESAVELAEALEKYKAST